MPPSSHHRFVFSFCSVLLSYTAESDRLSPAAACFQLLCSRVDLVETCKYLLAVDAIAAEQNIVVNEELLETEVEAAAADMGKQFDADTYRQVQRGLGYRVKV